MQRYYVNHGVDQSHAHNYVEFDTLTAAKEFSCSIPGYWEIGKATWGKCSHYRECSIIERVQTEQDRKAAKLAAAYAKSQAILAEKRAQYVAR